MTEFEAVLASELSRALNTQDIFQRNGLVADDWQADVLSLKHNRVLLNCCRQSGKTETAGALVCQIAGVREGSTVLYLSPTERQSKELIKRCSDLITNAGYGHEIASTKQLEITYKNRSRCIALPQNPQGIRGYSNVSALIIDEVAHLEKDEEIISAAMPFMAINPDAICIAMSTPNGARGWFWRQWTESNGWHKIQVTAHECPRISKAFLEEQRLDLGENKFRQEYECQFVSDGAAFISAEMFDACVIPNAGLI